jgi:predicted flap endonuclease-1-like 5' DNA nuclease
MPKSITAIEGIGPANADKLKGVGIRTVEKLLEMGASKKGRDELAEKAGISGKLILTWVNSADLFRVQGVGGQYAELLHAAGVDSVPELAQRKAENLHQKMTQINAEKNLTRRVPTLEQVAGWVAQAKTLPKVISH